MNNKGGALITVLIISAVLLILGLIAMQVVMADSSSALRDRSRSVSMQMAEGGLDFGLELIRDNLSDLMLLDGTTYNLSDYGEDITVEINRHSDTIYVVTSTATAGDMSRTVKAYVEVQSTPSQDIVYSIFTGLLGNGTVNNVTFEEPVYYGSQITVNTGSVFKKDAIFANSDANMWNSFTGATFWGNALINPRCGVSSSVFHKDVHFAMENKWLEINSNNTFLGNATREQNTIGGGITSSLPVAHQTADPVNFPDVNLQAYASNPEYHNWGSQTYIDDVTKLKEKNFFPNGAYIVFDGPASDLDWDTITIVSLKSVSFRIYSWDEQQPTAFVILTDAIGGGEGIEGDGIASSTLHESFQLYVYVKNGAGNLKGEMGLRSLITGRSGSLSNMTVHSPGPVNMPEEFLLLWPVTSRGFKIIRWEN